MRRSSLREPRRVKGAIGPGDSLEVGVPPSDSKARLYKRVAGYQTTLATSATSLSLTTNNWYTMKVVVGDDLGNSALQRLRFWVDTDDDGDWSDETALLDSTAVDDEWSAGYVGFYRGGPAAQQYDDFAVGIDNNADLDILDAGDDVLVSDDFNASTVTPAYDNNGQITFDGVWTYTYDAWRRPRKAQLVASGDTTTIQEVAWLGNHRLASRTVTNSGVENTPNDGGNTVIHAYHCLGRLSEERNGSNQVVRAYLWDLGGAGILPASPVWLEVNGDPTIGNDTNPDNVASGENVENPADGRYFYHTDAAGTVVALTEYAAGAGSVNGRVVERYTGNPHGVMLVLSGDTGSGEMSGSSLVSMVGNYVRWISRTPRLDPALEHSDTEVAAAVADGSAVITFMWGHDPGAKNPTVNHFAIPAHSQCDHDVPSLTLNPLGYWDICGRCGAPPFTPCSLAIDGTSYTVVATRNCGFLCGGTQSCVYTYMCACLPVIGFPGHLDCKYRAISQDRGYCNYPRCPCAVAEFLDREGTIGGETTNGEWR